MIIYKITNVTNKKVYVGQTVQSLSIRWKQHCQTKRMRACPLLQDAIRKYGSDNFTVETVESCASMAALNKQETYWINAFKSFGLNGYNLTAGGDAREITEDTKRKISGTLMGRPTARKGIPTNRAPWNKGKPWSEELKHKLSLAHYGQISSCKGKKMSEQQRAKLSEIKIGIPIPALFKSIICVTTGETFISSQSAAEILHLHKSNICMVLKKKRPHTRGLSFVYA